MKIEIVAQPVFILTLSKELVDGLMFAGRRHYDATCRRVCEVGGFVYGWRMRLDCSELGEVIASFRELDTTLKICEYPGAWPDSLDKAITEYTSLVRKALGKANELAQGGWGNYKGVVGSGKPSVR